MTIIIGLLSFKRARKKKTASTSHQICGFSKEINNEHNHTSTHSQNVDSVRIFKRQRGIK